MLLEQYYQTPPWYLLKRNFSKKVESYFFFFNLQREKKRNINLFEKKLEYIWRDQQNNP